MRVICNAGSLARALPIAAGPACATGRVRGDAANFVSAQGDTRVDLDWIGAWLYSPGYEAWCQAQGSQLNCTGGDNWSSYRKTSLH